MSRTPTTAESKAKTLAQQQSDFTSEGSPPPGHVATTTPAEGDRAPADAPKRSHTRRRTHLGKRR